MSGGRATVVQKKKGRVRMAHVSGDVCATDSIGSTFISMYYVECKHLRNLSLPALVARNSGKLIDIWRHTKLQARKVGRNHAMLIAQQNLLPKEKARPARAR